ncbi:nucleotide-binding universal stress UspA family protein [Rhodococcus sp. OK519]|uniref:universal stress protein n=1 Tax=Rhodococcus sp. OK519 TaxID=2135729 RepID=UPI000D3A9E89|nr:nucleotide-binding universal stress UspA family protein [Rhodococcus sp. OK519]
MGSSPIVVGVDGSASSRDAVRWAAGEASVRGDPLLLVSSVTTGGIGMASPFADDLRVSGESALQDAVELAAEVGRVDASTEMVALTPVQALMNHEGTARMIVLGTRGLGEFTGGLIGSVTSAIVHHAACPVVVVAGWPRPGEPAFDGPVVVGVDGTETSEPAVAAAFDEATLHGADLVALHAWSDRALPEGSVADTWTDIAAAEQHLLAERLAPWREKHPSVSVKQVIVQDRPARNLLMRGAGARLIVVGSRGRGGFHGMTLGSTSAALLRSTTIPLMVVRSH